MDSFRFSLNNEVSIMLMFMLLRTAPVFVVFMAKGCGIDFH